MKLNGEERKFLKLAIDTAEENITEGGGPFGAVIVRNGRVLATAGNRVVPGHDPTAHAEILAIRQAAQSLGTHDLSECVIYASCEPCPMCLGAIYWSGIRHIVYASDRYRAASAGFDDEKIYAELALGTDERSITMVQAMEEEGNRVMTIWEEFPDKIQY